MRKNPSFNSGERKKSTKEKRNGEKIDENSDRCYNMPGPVDKYNMVYCIFYLLGCGSLLPWNFFITANDYFIFKLRSEELLVEKFQNYFSLAAMVPNLVIMILNVFVLHRYSRFVRICVSLTLMILMFGLTSCLVLIETEKWVNTFFTITLCKMVVINVGVATLQGALCGMVSMFPETYIQAMMAGQGLGALFAAGANIISLFGQNDIRKSAFGYFNTATFVLSLSLVGYIVLERTEIAKFYTSNKSSRFHSCECVKSCGKKVIGKETLPSTTEASKCTKIIRQLAPVATSVFMIYFVTLSVFPSTTARIQSVSKNNNDWTEKFFVPVTCFLWFSIFDFIGKISTGFFTKPGSNGPCLVIACFSRMIFLILFPFCNVIPRTHTSLTIFDHDAYPITFMTIFGLSNGYLSSLAIMYAPRFVDAKDQELAGTIMAFCVVAGLAAGAAFSFTIASNL